MVGLPHGGTSLSVCCSNVIMEIWPKLQAKSCPDIGVPVDNPVAEGASAKVKNEKKFLQLLK